jgi:hypothetical protein
VDPQGSLKTVKTSGGKESERASLLVKKNKQLSYKDFKGIRKVVNIDEYYDFKTTIGRGNRLYFIYLGAFGEVFHAIHLKTGEKRAIKMIKRDKVNRAEILIKLQENEFKVLQDTVIYLKR